MQQMRREILAGLVGSALLAGNEASAAAATPPTSDAIASANPSMLKTFDLAHPTFIKPHPFATLKMVIQVSEDIPERWELVLNNAQNLLDFIGEEKIQIVVVAYGPGLRMLLANSVVGDRIASEDVEGVEFDACHHTMEGMAKHLGHLPVLVPQAVIVPSGVERILQLETHGFPYLKP